MKKVRECSQKRHPYPEAGPQAAMGNEVSNCCGPTRDFQAFGKQYQQGDQTQSYVPIQTAQPHELRAMFHRAAEAGDVRRLASIMRLKKVHLDDVDQSGNTALHKAAWHGHLTVCRVLVKYGANVRTGNRNGKTPLHFALQRGKRECAQYLEDIVHLPDPSEVKRKFRAKVKTSNCAKVFGPRRSIRNMAMLIPGVPESECQDDNVVGEHDPSPFSDARWGARRHEEVEHQPMYAAAAHAERPRLTLELPAKAHPHTFDAADDAFHSGRSTARAERSEFARGFPSPSPHCSAALENSGAVWHAESPASRSRGIQDSAHATPNGGLKARFAAMTGRSPAQPATSVSAELGFWNGQRATPRGGPADIWGGDTSSLYPQSAQRRVEQPYSRYATGKDGGRGVELPYAGALQVQQQLARVALV